MSVRLRQLVLAAPEREDINAMARVFGLSNFYRDEGLIEFGLVNGVFPIGDQFLEVVVPTREDAAGQRFLDKTGGDGGYMVLFQTDDLAAVRHRASVMEIRRVWDSTQDDIDASHFHPTDMGAAIVSIDQPTPPESWRWGGPDWQTNAVAGKFVGMTVSSPNPDIIARRWADVLDAPLEQDDRDFLLATDDGPVRFKDGRREKLAEYTVQTPDADAIAKRADVEGYALTQTGFHAHGVDFKIIT